MALFKGITVEDAIKKLQQVKDQKAILVTQGEFGAAPVTEIAPGVIYRFSKTDNYNTGCLFSPDAPDKKTKQQAAILMD